MLGVGPHRREEIRAWLVAAVARVAGVPVTEVATGSPFADLGITSAQAMSLVGELEERLGGTLPATLLYEYATIDALADALAAGVAADDPRPAAPPATAGGIGVVGVVGLACRFPGGADTPDRFWRNLCSAADASGPVPADRWDADRYHHPDPAHPGTAYTRRGGFLDDVAGFDAAFFGLSPEEALRTDPQQRLLLEVAWTALEDAGIAPDRLRGSRTGVFVGLMSGQEYLRVQTDREGAACLESPYLGYGSAPSVAAGRLSYALDLHGPALCVDTACSSSLLGVHLAAESLLRGECDLALAAGAGAVLHPATMVQACRAHMLAADGRCKTFDERADGFLIGEGCGVVVLERLSDAAARGHRVRAVLRGSAVGSDGRSNGMTAPSRAAQVAVVRAALARAGIAPADIGYVEAHGSGTRLGDAIEMAALQDVFGPDRNPARPLVVGAVKTNVGHLLGAAGIAGLIKAVLAVGSGRVPPNLNLDRPSTAIDWARCPVLLPREVVDLPGPRPVAGVSSFGWSGTNVHVVVQQAPGLPAREPADGAAVLLPLSAATPAALRAVARRLHEHLADRPEVAIGDVAHTLQAGRAALPYRLPLACRDRDDALAALRAAEGAEPAYTEPGTRPRVTYLLPGVGDQAVGMAGGLYRTEPVFRAAVDRCADVLRPELGVDLRELIDAAPTAGAGLAALLGRSGDPGDSGALHRADVAHSAVFAVGYATAQLWRHWGVPADALLGYSLGEYTAACLAGVFDPADAARLVARRARLLQRLPAGGMLAVARPAADLPALAPGVSVAADTGPAMAIVAGPAAALDRYERVLAAHGVPARRVPTGHALHTPQLEALRDEVAALVAAVPRAAPAVPFVSSVTGTWITPEQACDPAYWAEQMCRPVRFADGVARAAEPPGSVLLELGPGQALTSLALQILRAAGRADAHAVATLGPPQQPGDDRRQALAALGRLWAAGLPVAWDGVADPAARLVELPTYPFEHQRFWPSGDDRSPARPPDGDGKLPDLAGWCHAPVWKQSPALARPRPAAHRWLVLADGRGLADAVAGRLRGQGHDVVVVRPGTGPTRADGDGYLLDPSGEEGYERLADLLTSDRRLPARVLHAWAVPARGSTPAGRLAAAGERGFLGLLYLTRALARRGGGAELRLFALTAGAHEVVGGDGTAPEQATVLGLCQTVHHELPAVTCCGIDLEPAATPDPRTVDLLVAELTGAAGETFLAHRGGRRWVRAWEPVPLPAAEPEAAWRDRGVYLITGGFGGLGLALARYLATTVRARLVLAGRRPLPPRERWDDDAIADERIAAVRELEALGAEVLPAAADVAEPDQAAALVAQARARFGALHGVIHAAGVPGGGLIELKTRADVDRVLAPKVAGTLALYEALRADPPELFVTYSSSVVAFGGIGESDYCAANAFLDAFCWQARRAGFPATCVDWGPWQRDAWTAESLRGAPVARDALRALRDRYGLTDDEGTELLTRILAAGAVQLLVAPQDPAVLAERWRGLSTGLLAAPPGGTHPRPPLRTPFVPARTAAQRRVAEIWQRHLGVDRVGMDDAFFELGGNSLIGLTIAAEIERELGVRVGAADLFAAPTPGALAALVDGRAGDRPDGPPSPAPGQDPGRHGTGRGTHRRQLAQAAAARRGDREHRGVS